MSDQAVKAMEAALAKLHELNGCQGRGVMRCRTCAETVQQTRQILTDAILKERKEPNNVG
jgi:exonuclease VII small subunit